eukprot:TRINITY_DN655_c0_g1_i1.p1 TRINITY_DN655_c0_g1~~TRINITY_DN655_c0_g1_i1.p1  ORF type:complete len:300 (+),score=73.07 TRINITY_DN655_c0_g1_i1:112-1011(+)
MYSMPVMCQFPSLAKHACPICHKTFSRKGNMVRHLKLHQGIKPFECEECLKRFSTRCNLESHRKTHSKQPLTTCEFCGRQFRRIAFLRRHIKAHSENGDVKSMDFIKQARKQRHEFLQTRLEKAKQINLIKATRRKLDCQKVKLEFSQNGGEFKYDSLVHSIKTEPESSCNVIKTENPKLENGCDPTNSSKKLSLQEELSIAWAFLNAQIVLSEFSHSTTLDSNPQLKHEAEEGEIQPKMSELTLESVDDLETIQDFDDMSIDSSSSDTSADEQSVDEKPDEKSDEETENFLSSLINDE